MNLESRLYDALVYAISILRAADYSGNLRITKETFDTLERPASDYMAGKK